MNARLLTWVCLCAVLCTLSCETPENNTYALVWEKNNISISNHFDSLKSVHISGVTMEASYRVPDRITDSESEGLDLRGTMTVFGDVDGDQIPEFLLEHIVESSDSVYGYRNLYRIDGQNNIAILKSAMIGNNTSKCDGMLGYEEFLSFDSTSQVVTLTGKYGHTSRNGSICEGYAFAESVVGYKWNSDRNYLQEVSECAVQNGKLDLAAFYRLNESRLRNLSAGFDLYYGIPGRVSDLANCDNIEDGIRYLEEMSGIQYINRSKEGKREDLMEFIGEEFNNINPDFVKWASNNLIPDPRSKQISGLPYKLIYDQMFQDRIRRLALARLFILTQGQERAMAVYSQYGALKYYNKQENRVMSRNYDMLGSHLNFANGELDEFLQKHELAEPAYNDVNDYGFWIRRMLDGSEPEIWLAMVKILKSYDGEWYTQTFTGKSWKGVVEVDKEVYDSLMILSESEGLILGPDEMPPGLADETENGVTVYINGGGVKEFKNNPSDGESNAQYTIGGYWVEKNMVLVDYIGWEWGNTEVVSLDDGTTESKAYNLTPSKGAQYLAEQEEEMEWSALNLYDISGPEPIVIVQLANHFYTQGFWMEGTFYFQEGSRYYKYDDLIL